MAFIEFCAKESGTLQARDHVSLCLQFRTHGMLGRPRDKGGKAVLVYALLISVEVMGGF